MNKGYKGHKAHKTQRIGSVVKLPLAMRSNMLTPFLEPAAKLKTGYAIFLRAKAPANPSLVNWANGWLKKHRPTLQAVLRNHCVYLTGRSKKGGA